MKTAVITGASRGIGKALAENFLVEGYAVIGTSRSGKSEIVHEHLTMLPLELVDAKSRKACVEAIIARGPIDVLINNAGIFDEREEGAPEVNIDALRLTLEVNLIGVIDFTEHVVPALGEGSYVINISSRRGSMDYTEDSLYPAYSISKAGLNMYTRKLAARLEGRTTVSCAHPGVVRTQMNPEGPMSPEESADAIYKLVSEKVPSGRFWSEGEEFPW